MQKKIKSQRQGFLLSHEAAEILTTRATERAQSKTQVIEDLLLDRRQFDPEVERCITAGMFATGKSARQYIAHCILQQQPQGRRPFDPTPVPLHDGHIRNGNTAPTLPARSKDPSLRPGLSPFADFAESLLATRV